MDLWIAIQFVCLVILMAFIVELQAGKRKHRDESGEGEGTGVEGAKKKKKKEADTCVLGYCLDPSYNSLELPSKDTVTHVRMNLEVREFSYFLLVIIHDLLIPCGTNLFRSRCIIHFILPPYINYFSFLIFGLE